MPVDLELMREALELVQRIAERIGRSLERSGLITRDVENAYLAFDPGEEAEFLVQLYSALRTKSVRLQIAPLRLALRK
jgi:hypothetical protein